MMTFFFIVIHISINLLTIVHLLVGYFPLRVSIEPFFPILADFLLLGCSLDQHSFYFLNCNVEIQSQNTMVNCKCHVPYLSGSAEFSVIN